MRRNENASDLKQMTVCELGHGFKHPLSKKSCTIKSQGNPSLGTKAIQLCKIQTVYLFICGFHCVKRKEKVQTSVTLSTIDGKLDMCTCHFNLQVLY
jgi:hypothetical protein